MGDFLIIVKYLTQVLEKIKIVLKNSPMILCNLHWNLLISQFIFMFHFLLHWIATIYVLHPLHVSVKMHVLS